MVGEFFKRHRIFISIFGCLILTGICFHQIRSFKKVFSASIIIKKPVIEVFHIFFTAGGLSSFFPDASSVIIEGRPGVGATVVFHIKEKSVRYKIVEFKEFELVKWKSLDSYHEFVFENNPIGTVVHYRFYVEGLIAFIFQYFNRDRINRYLMESLLLLKQLVEKQ